MNQYPIDWYLLQNQAELCWQPQQLRMIEANLLHSLLCNLREIKSLALLAHLRLLQQDHVALQELYKLCLELNPNAVQTRWLLAECWLLDRTAFPTFEPNSSLQWQQEEIFLPLWQAHVRALLLSKQFVSAADLLSRQRNQDSLFVQRLKAELASAEARHLEAVEILRSLVEQYPYDLALQEHYLRAIIDARASVLAIPAARAAVIINGEHPALLGHITTLKLHQRQPGLARRALLMQAAWCSIQSLSMNHSNQLITYEQSGHVDWLEYIYSPVLSKPLQMLELHSNLVLQLASIESSHTKNHVDKFLDTIRHTPAFSQHQIAGIGVPRAQQQSHRPLRIAWICGDLAPHPVSRFLLGFFAGSQGLRQQQHQLVSVFSHGDESNSSLFEALSGLDVIDVSGSQDHHRVAAVRALEADVAIDLSGWTGGNFLAGFLARLAPVQVNYLGYFASSGVPEMDYWLGDHQLFPKHISEWHSEELWRLPRPFLAWQPPVELSEAHQQVTAAPTGSIRFGSFNHNRKLSDATLRLWGALLERIPGSILVLKANAKDDSATQELLRRRMLRYGLDPERVDWLPLTNTAHEHLEQYKTLDVALDPIPNGGCTTTCEALWMGVPVITLAGATYVSRMSTAVLHGALLPEWVCGSPEAYLSLACAQADQLQALRSSRDHWRRQLQSSPLGDAADLMYHLEHAFSAMHVKALARDAVCI